MHKLKNILWSSIGKKEFMAISGLALLGFLVVHLGGNLNIYRGAAAFDEYAHTLHSFPLFVQVFELGLLAIALLHICFATILVVKNLMARPQRYAAKRVEGGRTWASRTMIFTGPFIACFVVFHLLQFTFIDKGGRTIATIVSERFHDPCWAAFYGLFMFAVGLHVSHGFWSACQTLGFISDKRGALRGTSTLFGWVFLLGFGLLPVAVYVWNVLQ